MTSIATLTTYPAVWLAVPYVLGTLEKDFFLVVVATLLVINLISTNLDALRILHQPLGLAGLGILHYKVLALSLSTQV